MNQPTNRNARGSALFNLIGGIVILLATLYFLVKLATGGYQPGTVEESTRAAVQTRIQPQGSITEGDGVPVGERKGDKIFAKVCVQCHAADSNTPDSPKITHNAEWAPRIAKGLQTLFDHAWNGFNAMPAKGGQSDLTEQELKRVIVYMANQSGGSFPDPDAAPAAAPASGASEAAASAAPAAEGAKEAGAAGGEDVAAAGKKVFDGLCFGCHSATSAIPDTPRITHNDEWAPRIKKGKDTLFKHAIEGFTDKGMMPAKGGNEALTDDEVKAAVVYMVNQSGGKF
ncbi:Cytochrome c555 [Kingella potus]|uniref:Cytochrome c555 n=1 Tax=Kingella potus TaxID=265175 RepID=A0A377R214_9NEIS|nr:c-type cytochrome [Kingella potus]UOP00395.1 c-type cytochrome [Kingella potus]STR02536.1 Cytochrome c555 [Kingella potus]